MKVNESKDGVLRATIAVSFRIDFAMAVDCLIARCSLKDLVDGNFQPKKLSRKYLANEIRDALYDNGINVWAHAEGTTADDRRKVETVVRKYFPELPPPKTKP